MKKIIKYLLVISLFIGYIPQMEQKIKASTNELEGLNLSILGASISTFAGTSNGIAANTSNSTIRNNAKYYPHSVVSDVRLEDTYWMQLVDDFGLNLLVNNSWSGSSLLHTRSGTVGAYVNRCLQLHDDTGANAGEEPDIIGIQMGFNDFQYYKDTLGNADIHYNELIVEENGLFTYGTPTTTLEACAIMLHKIKVRYPNAELYYLNVSDFVNLDETSKKILLDYNENLEIVCDYFDVTVVDIYNAIPKDTLNSYIGDNKVHPNRLGMDCYTEAFKKAILENTKYHVDTHVVSVELKDVLSDYGSDKIVVDGDSFELNLTTPKNNSLEVKVFMGESDITSKVVSNGKIKIDEVIDDVRIYATSVHASQTYLFNGTENGLVCDNNELTLKSGTVSNGQYNEVSYQLENEVILKHDKNWIVEWKSSGSNANGGTGVRLFTTKYSTTENNSQFIFKGNKSGLIFIGERVDGKSHNYGIELNDYGIDTSLEHTYRLMNKIHDDGSNMVYLYVDGNYIGPMDNYYIGSTDNQNTKSNWLNGKDLSFSYIGSNTHGLSNCEMDYIHVFEDTKKLLYPYGYKIDISNVEASIIDAGVSKQVIELGVNANDKVVENEANQLIMSGVGNAIIRIGKEVFEIEVMYGNEKITVGDFKVASVAASSLTSSTKYLSQKTLMAVPYRGANLVVKVNDGYQVRVHSGNNHAKITSVSEWIGKDHDQNDYYTLQLPSNSIYMRFSIQKTDGSNITLEDFTKAGFEVSYCSEHDIVKDNQDVIDVLNQSDDAILIHLSDIHGDIIRAERALKFAQSVGVDALIASGDLTAYRPVDWGSALLDVFNKYDVNVIYGIGNHDAANIKSNELSQQIYENYYKDVDCVEEGKTYYYKDLVNHKLRIVSINQQEGATSTTSGGTCFSQEQVDWLIQTLKNTPSGYGVVFMYHSPEVGLNGSIYQNYSEFFQQKNRNNSTTSSYSNYKGTLLCDLVDAFMLGKSLNVSYSEGNGSSKITVNADFSDLNEGVEFIAHVTGHNHGDAISYMPGTASKQLMLNTTCTTAMYGKDGGYGSLADVSDLNRDANGKSQDAFNAYIIDRENKTIRVLRVGADVNNEGLNRKDMTIPYSKPFEEGEYLFDTTGKYKLDLEKVEWVNYGIQAYGTEPTYYPGARWSTNKIFDTPYDGITFYIKINAPYEVGIRSGLTETSMNTNTYWFNNKELIGGTVNRGYIYTVPSGHKKFIISFGNVLRNHANNPSINDVPVNQLEFDLAGLEFWYTPKEMSMKYDDHMDITGKEVEILDAGKPTSYQVGYGVNENSVFDTSVVKIENNQLIASGIGEAIVKIDGIVHKITVSSAPISLLLLLGQSNMQGSEGDANQSIICPDGMVYATYGDRYTMTTSNATKYAPSALTGDYKHLNVNGTTDYLKDYPVTSLNASGAGKPGPDSGFAYEWVKATGEKVWIVNAAHGGSSITTWQENGANYKEAIQLFNACQETLRKEIHAGHYTFSHMGYYWLQGCSDKTQTPQWYVEKYLAMHNNLKENCTFDHDTDSNTPNVTFEFGNSILVMAGSNETGGYRSGTYTDKSSGYFSTFKELQMKGPRVAQLWMANNKELSDIHVVSNIGDSWLTMPNGEDGVVDYFQAHYPNGRVDYVVQVAQKESFYTPTKAKDVKDTIHYNQIGYNEIGIDAARNTCIMLGYLEDKQETSVKFVDWTGYQEVSEIKASTVGNTNTLVVPLISPIYKSKEIEFEVSGGLTYNYFDLLSNTPLTAGTLKVKDRNQTVSVHSKDFENYHFELEDGKLVSTGENENKPTLISGKIENGIFTNVQYQLADEIYLKHDIEWIVEWKIDNWIATGGMLLSTSKSSTTKEPYIYINPNYHFVGLGEYNGSNHINYGYQLKEFGIDVTDGPHVYRLANKVENDSNMIYLFVDGKEIGPITHYYKGMTTYLGESDWVVGKDFSFTYIGSSNYPMSSMTLEYLIASEKNNNVDIHFHDWNDWKVIQKGNATTKEILERTCKTCNQTETKEVETIWQKYDFANHVSELPENVCSGLNLWNILPHDKEYFISDLKWGINSLGTVTSVTFAVQEGDKIYASSFGKAGTNGTNANGIRMTYFTDYDVLKTLSPSQVYEEFSKNGYMIVPEGATYINIPMWSDSSDWEIYILNKEHHYTSEVVEPTCAQGYTIYTCDVCGHSYKDNFVDGIGHTFTDYMSNHDALPDQDGTKTAKCNTCDETNTIVDVGSSLGYEIFEGKIISVLGDSISTFAGYVPEADGFNLFHHSRYPQDNLFNEVEKTYWMQMVNRMNAKLGINDSWRSTTVQNTYTQEQAGTFYGTKTAMSTLTRIQNLGSNGTPDIILFYGGTNDIARNMKLVEFDENNAPTLNLVDNVWDSFTEAYCQTLLRMKHYYPNAQIIAMLPTYTKTYYPNDRLAQYNAVMKEICEYYDVTYIDLREAMPSASYLPDGIHPGEEGMTLIANATMKLLLLNTSEFEKGNHETYQITHKLTSATASKGYYKAVDANSTFTETITGIGLSVQVKMNGVDITDTCVVGNTITIEKVTGNVEIIAKAVYDFGNHLQTIPNSICPNTNIWNLLEHDKQYYTVSGWGTHTSGTVTSVTFNVQANDKIYATSFGSASTNGGTGNGIRVTYFNENGVVKSMTSSEVYNEFSKNGYLTVPSGVSVVNIPMWTISDENEIYILNKEHSFKEYVSNYDGTKTAKCEHCDETNTIADDCILGDIDGNGKVNTLDRMILSRYLAHWSGYDTINTKAADVNLDGQVNAMDRMILARHLARWQGYETLPKLD